MAKPFLDCKAMFVAFLYPLLFPWSRLISLPLRLLAQALESHKRSSSEQVYWTPESVKKVRRHVSEPTSPARATGALETP